MMKNKTGIILKSVAVLLILAEILFFFFLPVATFKRNDEFVYATMFDMIRFQQIYVLPDITFISHYSIFQVVPYILFIIGVVATIIKGERFSTTIFSIVCVVASFLILCLTCGATCSYAWVDFGYTAHFDDQSWIFVILALCVVAIVFFFVYYFKTEIPIEEAEASLREIKNSENNNDSITKIQTNS